MAKVEDLTVQEAIAPPERLTELVERFDRYRDAFHHVVTRDNYILLDCACGDKARGELQSTYRPD